MTKPRHVVLRVHMNVYGWNRAAMSAEGIAAGAVSDAPASNFWGDAGMQMVDICLV